MCKRFLAVLLVLTMILAVVPATSLAASKGTGRVTGNSAAISITDRGVMLDIKWNKVADAAGYEYAYNLFWKKGSKKSDYRIVSTDKTNASIRLKDYGTIDIYARAWKKTRGKKVYGEWTHGRMKRSQVDKMIVNRLKKTMKTKTLFLKAKSKSVAVRTQPGQQYGAVATLNKGDEVRATGSFKRDDKGTWWSKVTASIDQNTTVKGWVSRKDTDPVWY